MKFCYQLIVTIKKFLRLKVQEIPRVFLLAVKKKKAILVRACEVTRTAPLSAENRTVYSQSDLRLLLCFCEQTIGARIRIGNSMICTDIWHKYRNLRQLIYH